MEDTKRFNLDFLENTMMEMKTTLGRISTRVDTTEEKTSELEYAAKKLSKMKHKKEEKISQLRDNFK